jgi:sugar-specific transcriptional regulator TrmB
LDLLKSENCVFCGQKFDEKAKELIENYKKIFSITYEELKNEIKQKGDKFINIDLEKEILKFSNLEITFDSIDYQKFYDYKKNIDEKIKEKQLDLNKLLDFSSDSDFIGFEKIYEDIK